MLNTGSLSGLEDLAPIEITLTDLAKLMTNSPLAFVCEKNLEVLKVKNINSSLKNLPAMQETRV